MTWTKEDTEALRTGHTGRHDWERAADHIEALEKRIAELEAERAETAAELRQEVASNQGNSEAAENFLWCMERLAARLERKGERWPND